MQQPNAGGYNPIYIYGEEDIRIDFIETQECPVYNYINMRNHVSNGHRYTKEEKAQLRNDYREALYSLNISNDHIMDYSPGMITDLDDYTEHCEWVIEGLKRDNITIEGLMEHFEAFKLFVDADMPFHGKPVILLLYEYLLGYTTPKPKNARNC